MSAATAGLLTDGLWLHAVVVNRQYSRPPLHGGIVILHVQIDAKKVTRCLSGYNPHIVAGAELPASQVGTRRFARGRAYVADRYDVTEAEAAAETAEAAAAGEADLEEAKAKLAETEAVETVETVETAEETAEAPAAEEKE